MNRWNSILCLAAVASITAACGNGDRSCVQDDDCFRGEVCIEQTCQAEPGTAANNTTVSPANNTTVSPANKTSQNNQTTSTNNTTPLNNTTTNNSTTPTSSNNTVVAGQCKVDPFTAMCPADDNDSFWEYLQTETGRGCLGGGDDFEGGEFVLLDQVMCPLEAADKFNTNLIPCDNVTFVVEVTVTPQQSCNPDDWDFNMTLQGNDCIETNDKMRCETLPDGSKRATGFLEPSGSITSPYIEITPVAENLQFDYDLKIIVRE